MKIKATDKPLKTSKPVQLWVRIGSSVLTTILLLAVLTFLYIVLGFNTVAIGFNLGFLMVYIITDQLAYIMHNEFLQLIVTIAGMCGAALLTIIFLTPAFITLILCVIYGLWNLVWLYNSILKKGT
jgi:hypothetical protein